jgi:hypothetical protein
MQMGSYQGQQKEDGVWKSSYVLFHFNSQKSSAVRGASRHSKPMLTIYAPMIYTAPCIMFWMHAYPLLGQVGGGWALDIESFLGPVKWHRADMQVPFGAQKTWRFVPKSMSWWKWAVTYHRAIAAWQLRGLGMFHLFCQTLDSKI